MVTIENKQIIIRALFALEMCICLWVYLFGVHGWYRLIELRNECQSMRQTIARKQQEIEAVQEQITAWNTHSFYKEKMAREQLQMARKNDLIYYLN